MLIQARRRAPLLLRSCVLLGVFGDTEVKESSALPTRGHMSKLRELEVRWVCNYWQPLNDDYLKQLIKTVGQVNRQQHWASFGRLLVRYAKENELGFLDGHGWTMVPSTSSEGGPPDETPAYIPTLGTEKVATMTLGIFKSELEAHQKLRGTLTHQEWQRLKAVKEDWFNSCDFRYLECASIICTYFHAPYGQVTKEMACKITEKLGNVGLLDNQAQLDTKARWTTACLLEHSDVDPDTLAEFCACTLRFEPTANHPQSLLRRFCRSRRQISSIENVASCLKRIKANMLLKGRIEAGEFVEILRSNMSTMGKVSFLAGGPLDTSGHGSSETRYQSVPTTQSDKPLDVSLPASGKRKRRASGARTDYSVRPTTQSDEPLDLSLPASGKR